ncbi:Hypothetical protein CINCED_3A002957 [Cinara cedri]|uniref:Uncharacterized protein n=1 Tax=Cinara cedri TaxID=506608 RepID=A0A5E4MC17_9HEMI|nr:Hypothetical protein CINCED_3A002957 [Cinara cedri]
MSDDHITSNTAAKSNQNANYYDEHQMDQTVTEMVSADIPENKMIVLDQITADRKINDKQDVTLDEKLMNLRVQTLRNYDEIINSVDKLKEDIIVKDIKISDLNENLRSIQEEKNRIIHLVQEQFSTELVNTTNFSDDHEEFGDSRKNEELYNGKLLISVLINQLDEGSSNFEIKDYLLTDLINMFARSVINKEEQLEVFNKSLTQNIKDENRQLIKEIDDQKEWQKHLENENEKLNSKIEKFQRVQTVLMSKENENNNIKENYLKIQCMYDDLREENAHLKMLVNSYKHQLTKKEMKCVDGDALIKTLQLNLTEQTNNYKQAITMHNNEKEKCQEIQYHMQQMIDEFTTRIHEKKIIITSIQDECSTLKGQIGSAEAEIENLKHNIITLEYVLNEKNTTIQHLLKKTSEEQNTKKSLVHFKDMQILRKLVEQMNIIRNDLFVCKEKLLNNNGLMNSMQILIEQQCTARTAENENNKLTENINRENIILLKNLQREIDCLKIKHNLKIKNLTDTEVRLKNEILSLEKNLKLKSSQIVLVEKIAHLQLSEAFTMIENLREESKELKLNNIILKAHNVAQPSTVIIIDKKIQQQMKGLIYLVKKLRYENKRLRKLAN